MDHTLLKTHFLLQKQLRLCKPLGFSAYQYLEAEIASFERLAGGNSEWHTSLQRLGESEGDTSLEPLTEKLRQIFFQELLGENRQEYQEFLAPFVHDYEKEMHHFTNTGFYDSPIGNAMPLALATTLHCSITIFSASSSQPTMCVSPLGVDWN